MTHYASRSQDPCPTADPGMPLKTACDLTLPEVARRGEQARDDIAAVTCEDCLYAHQIWTDMNAARKNRETTAPATKGVKP